MFGAQPPPNEPLSNAHFIHSYRIRFLSYFITKYRPTKRTSTQETKIFAFKTVSKCEFKTFICIICTRVKGFICNWTSVCTLVWKHESYITILWLRCIQKWTFNDDLNIFLYLNPGSNSASFFYNWYFEMNQKKWLRYSRLNGTSGLKIN